MRARYLAVLLLALLVAAGCATGEPLKARQDNPWSPVLRGLADTHNPNPSGYGHPLRFVGFALHPVGVVLDYAVVQPIYILGGLAPWLFGLTVEDGQRYQAHFPEVLTPQSAPRRFE